CASVKDGGNFVERPTGCRGSDQDARPDEPEMDGQIGSAKLLPRDLVQALSCGDSIARIAVKVNRRSRPGGDLFQEQCIVLGGGRRCPEVPRAPAWRLRAAGT